MIKTILSYNAICSNKVVVTNSSKNLIINTLIKLSKPYLKLSIMFFFDIYKSSY